MTDFEMIGFEMIGEFLESVLAVKWLTFEIETDKMTQIVEMQDSMLSLEHFEMQKFPVALFKKL